MAFDNPTEALIISLNKQLERARHAYYVTAEPILTDAEYDALEARLKAAVNNNPRLASLATVLTTVGNDAKSGDRIKHLRPMLSIENKYTKEDVVAFCLDLPAGTAYCIEPKRDGISAEIAFRGGVLAQAVTRGTGTEGEDMTAQVKALRSVPKTLTYNDSATFVLKDGVFPVEIRVRGELVMRDGELDRINAEATAKGQKTYASTRNLTAGTMKQKDLSVVASREIVFVPWDVYSPDNDAALPDSNFERMQMLNQLGFETYAGLIISGNSRESQPLALGRGITLAIDTILAHNAKSDIRADGVVIKVDSHKLRRELGVASKFTNWMTCFKPQSLKATTHLREVIWQSGRSGKLTPVGIVDPVVLAGATVTRVTLNNETWIKTMGLQLGCTVEICRSGDVIPLITKVYPEPDEL